MSQKGYGNESRNAMPNFRPNGMRGPGGPGGHMHGRPVEKPKNAKKTVSRLLSYLGGSAGTLIVAIGLVFISSLSGVAATWFLKPLVNSFFKGADLATLGASLLAMGAIYIVAALTAYISSRMLMKFAQRTSNRIRSQLFAHMMDLPLRFFDSKSHGEVMSRFTNDVDNINIAFEQSLSQTITSAITVVGVFIIMLILSPILTLFALLFLAVMMGIIRTVSKKGAGFFRAQQKALGEMNGLVEEMMEGQKVIKVFHHEAMTAEHFKAKNENMRRAATNAQTYAGIIMPITGNLSYMNYAVTVMVGAVLVINGQMDIGTIAAFLQYTRSFSMPLTQIANQFNMLLSALAGAERIFEVLDTPVESDDGHIHLVKLTPAEAETLMKERRAAQREVRATGRAGENDEAAEEEAPRWVWQGHDENGSVVRVPVRGDIRFHHVSFGYDADRDVLKTISVFARPGQKIAFVGSTGAGKTTITNLINRFYDIQSGQITYDGIDIRNIAKRDLRRALGMVLQDVHLFKGTVRENIRYGNLDATDSDIRRAAMLANAHAFIMKLPNGYDTMLEPDGQNLSQGQRQLLSIARAAVADPPVLILDEATSSVDTHTEKLIETGMDQLMHGRTTLAIAHRLSTIRNANAIMVLENGEIIERGDHEELLDVRGRYWQLYTGMTELA